MAEPEPAPGLQFPACESSDAAKAAAPPPPEPEPEMIDADDLVSGLPTRGGWTQPLALYQNYWLTPTRLRHSIPVKHHYTPRRDDILLATFPKCGTTWLKALAVAITTRRITDGGGHQPHPQELVPHLEMPALAGDLAHIERMPSPRLLATHLPLSLLPPAVVSGSGCRVVYLCRHPKDAFVSWWFFGKTVVTTTTTTRNKGPSSSSSSTVKLELEDAVRMFCDGFSHLGPFWEHYLEYRTGDVAVGDGIAIGRKAFFRKGQVGDWENHLTEEMGKQFDQVLQDKFKGTGLVF